MGMWLRTSVFCGVLLYMTYTVSGQGGGIPLGFGGGDLVVDGPFGEMPSPFLALATGGPATGPPPISGVMGTSVSTGATPPTATTPPIGSGFNPSDVMSIFEGQGPGVPVNNDGSPANTNYLVQNPTPAEQPVQPATGLKQDAQKLTVQIDPMTGKEFTLQNEAYTPIGSVGNLVKVPTDQNRGTVAADTKSTNTNAGIDHVIVKPVNTVNAKSQKATDALTQTSIGGGINTFNPGTGAVDEISALQSASSLLGSPVDMSNFLPPPYNPSNDPASSQSQRQRESLLKTAAIEVPMISEFNANPNEGLSVSPANIPNNAIMNQPNNQRQNTATLSIPESPASNIVPFNVPNPPPINTGSATSNQDRNTAALYIPDNQASNSVAIDVPSNQAANTARLNVPGSTGLNTVALNIPNDPSTKTASLELPNNLGINTASINNPGTATSNVPASNQATLNVPDNTNTASLYIPDSPTMNSAALNIPGMNSPANTATLSLPDTVAMDTAAIQVPDNQNMNTAVLTVPNDPAINTAALGISGALDGVNPQTNQDNTLATSSQNTGSNTNIGGQANSGLNNQNANPSSNMASQPQAVINPDQAPRTSLRDMFSRSRGPEPNTGLIQGNANDASNEPNTPHLQDMTAEGIYPFEGSSTARDATLPESKGVIQDMNKAIAGHNTTETLHLESSSSVGQSVPPLTGTNGGPITNLVGVKPPEVIAPKQDPAIAIQPLSGTSQNVNTKSSDNMIPGSFMIGAGMPNAQVIQAGLVSDTVSAPDASTGGGLAIGTGPAASISGMNVPSGAVNTVDRTNVAALKETAPVAVDMTNMVPPPFTSNNNVFPMGQPQGGFMPNQALNRNRESVNQNIVQPPQNNISPDLNLPVPSQAAGQLDNSALPTIQSLAQALNNNANTPLSNILTQPNFGMINEPMPLDSGLTTGSQQSNAFANTQEARSNVVTSTGMNLGGPPRESQSSPISPPGPVPNVREGQNLGSNQQIISVKPGWLTNVFGPTGQGLSMPTSNERAGMQPPSQLNIVPPKMAPLEPSISPIGPSPSSQPVIDSTRRNTGNQLPTPREQSTGLMTSFTDSQAPKPSPDSLQIVPLQNRPMPIDSGNRNKVFTLGEHRVIHQVPSNQQANMADYQTQNVIGTSETKPLVSDGSVQTNNIPKTGMPSTSIEEQLKKLMMLQDAQLAMSRAQTQSQDQNLVRTSFEAPGMTVRDSVAVQESFVRRPNVVTIKAQSNVPVTENRPTLVQQPIAGGINDVSGMKSNQGQLPTQLGLIEPRLDQVSNQQGINMFNTNPMFSQSGSNVILTGDQAVPLDIGAGLQNSGVTTGQQTLNSNTLNSFASDSRLGQPVAAFESQPSRGTAEPMLTGIMLPRGSPNSEVTQFTSGSRRAVFGSALGDVGTRSLGTGGGNTGMSLGSTLTLSQRCNYEAHPTSPIHFIMRQYGASHTFRCALGTAFDPVSCECSTRVVGAPDCLEVHMDFNNGKVEDSSYNKLPIGNQNVEVTNKSTPLSGIALFNPNSKLTIWRYQNYDFRDQVMLKVQFRPGQQGDRFQPLISNCDGGIEGPSIGIIYDSTLKEVLLVLKTVNGTKKEMSFKINPQEWNDVTYIYDGREFIGIVNGVRRYVSRTDPHLLGIIGGDIKAVPVTGLIEIRDAGIILGHCPRYGHYTGAMVDIQIYTCIPKNFRLE